MSDYGRGRPPILQDMYPLSLNFQREIHAPPVQPIVLPHRAKWPPPIRLYRIGADFWRCRVHVDATWRPFWLMLVFHYCHHNCWQCCYGNYQLVRCISCRLGFDVGCRQAFQQPNDFSSSKRPSYASSLYAFILPLVTWQQQTPGQKNHPNGKIHPLRTTTALWKVARCTATHLKCNQ